MPFYTELKSKKNKNIMDNIIYKKYITELNELQFIYYKHICFQSEKYYLKMINSDV